MKKKIILPVMVGLLMVLATVGVTYAFFNYTRTGSANTVRTGTINFTSSQTRINLSNVFPIASSAVSTDTDNVGTATITVEGDTTYDKGIEYLISATNVTNTVGTKNIPISISAEVSGTLGTSDENYFDNRETSTNHIYKVLADDTINNDGELMVGYIAKGQTGINGTITIKAYIDKDKILISDTYPEGEEVINGVTYYNGTPTTDKTVFTTTEWNSLNTNGISFQVKVEANEGIWVNPLKENAMRFFGSNSNTIYNQRLNITKVYFKREKQSVIDAKYENATIKDDLTYNNQGSVKGWLEEDTDNSGKYILYVESDGITKLTSCLAFFQSYPNIEYVEFGNVDTSDVTDFSWMFSECSKLTSLDLSSFNTENAVAMEGMFSNCSGLLSLNLNNFDTGNVTSMRNMFYNCSNLVTLTIDNFNTEKVTIMESMFHDCQKLASLNLSKFNTASVERMNDLFFNCKALTSLNLSSFNTNNVTTMHSMFYGCAELVTVYVSDLWVINSGVETTNMFINAKKIVGEDGTTFSWDHFLDGEWARVDDLPDNPGYFTYLAAPTI